MKMTAPERSEHIATSTQQSTLHGSHVEELLGHPTELQKSSLPQVIDHIPLSAWAVIVAGAFERFTYFGIIAPWQNYMQNPRTSPGRSELPGALDLGQSTATSISNGFFLVSFITPVIFAILADQKIGRYKALLIGLLMYLVGCIILVSTSAYPALKAGAGLPGLMFCMIFIAFGAGSIKACFVPFLGDQLRDCHERLITRRDGGLAIVSPERTLQFLYNAYYWFTNMASLSSIAVTYIEREYGFWQCYLLTAIALALGIIFYIAWSPRFAKVEPQGNALPHATRALKCAAKNGFRLDHAKGSYQQTKFGVHVPWNDAFVEEIREGLVACRVIFSLLIFYLVISQMYNNLISQAGSMLLSGIPNDLPQAFSGVACIIFGPLIQAIYSLLARYRIKFGPIARLVVAFIFCGLSMAYAAIVQHLIYSSPPCYSRPLSCFGSKESRSPNEITIWVQLPVYFLLAVGEILGFVTAFEYAYSKAPVEMKSLVMAFSQSTAGIASAIGMAIGPAAKDPNMVIMYAVLAGCTGVTAGIFFWKFRQLDASDSNTDVLRPCDSSNANGGEELGLSEHIEK